MPDTQHHKYDQGPDHPLDGFIAKPVCVICGNPFDHAVHTPPPAGEQVLYPDDPNDACLVCGGAKEGSHPDHNYIDRRTMKHG